MTQLDPLDGVLAAVARENHNSVPDNNYVKVPLTDVLTALRACRTSLTNQRKVSQKHKLPDHVVAFTIEIHKMDAKIALLEAGPKNQSFLIPLREAHNWGFGMMPNGRWPKL
jgi:hypothetical protein